MLQLLWQLPDVPIAEFVAFASNVHATIIFLSNTGKLNINGISRDKEKGHFLTKGLSLCCIQSPSANNGGVRAPPKKDCKIFYYVKSEAV